MYKFNVIYDKSEPGFIDIFFPDFGWEVTCVDNDHANLAGEYARDFLRLKVEEYMEAGRDITTCDPDDIVIRDNQELVEISF